MVTPVVVPSKTQINKAGRTIRRWMRAMHEARSAAEVHAVDDSGVDAALHCLIAYRAAHQYPLQKATMGLRSMVKTEGCTVEVSQRLKRAPTIIDKLYREPTMQLANMQDIGGCRAVLASVDEVRRVQRRLSRRRKPLRVSDYIMAPRTSGYRGVHVVVEYDDRAIEVQLRTQVMHEWAITVERLAGRLNVDLKSSVGPPEVLALLQLISEAMAVEERGETVPSDLLAEMAVRRHAAVPWLTGGGS